MPERMPVRERGANGSWNVPMIRFTLAWIALTWMQGCVSYDETGVVHPDGTGEVRIAIGLARDNVDHQRIGEVKRVVSRLKGLRWLSDFDSSAGARRWTGAVIHFDSVEALRPLNTVIALESLFGNISMTETDSGTVLRRTILLPSGTHDDGDFNRVSWTFPGTIVGSDRRARIDSSKTRARWSLPLGDGNKETAALMVRWKKPILVAPSWVPALPESILGTPRQWWLLGLEVACFLAVLVLAILVPTRLKPRVRAFVRNGRRPV